MSDNSATYGAAVLSITQGFASYTYFLPKLVDVRKADPSDLGMRDDVRIGEIAGTVITFGIAAMVSNLTGSPVPAITALIMSAVIVIMYETVLNSTGVHHAEPV